MKHPVAVLLISFAQVASAQVLVAPDGGTFDDRIDWATEIAGSRGWSEFWLGFSTRRDMPAGSFYGSYGGSDRVPLADLISEAAGGRPDLRDAIRRSLDRIDQAASGDVIVSKEIAVLIRFRGDGIRDVDVADLSSGVRLEGMPLLWTGPASGPRPVDWLIGLYRTTEEEHREDLVGAIALQESTAPIGAFLRRELREAASADVREAAAWWLGDRLGGDATGDLAAVAARDRSADVREAAIFALSRIDTDDARRAIVQAARDRSSSDDVREAARFALVRWAQERGGDDDARADDAADNRDAAIQKTALYALADLSDSLDIDLLIRTARDHRSADVRRAALYMLADLESDAALDALVELSGVRIR